MISIVGPMPEEVLSANSCRLLDLCAVHGGGLFQAARQSWMTVKNLLPSARCNQKIAPAVARRGCLRWIAVSRPLLIGGFISLETRARLFSSRTTDQKMLTFPRNVSFAL